MLDKSRLEFHDTLERYRKALRDSDSALADKLYAELIQLAASGRFPKTETEHALSEIAHSREVSSQGDLNAEAVAKLRAYMSDEKRAERRQQRAEARAKTRRDSQRRLAQRVFARAGRRVVGSIVAPETTDPNFYSVLSAQIVDVFGDGALDVIDGIIESIASGGSDSLWVAKKEFTPYLDSSFDELQALGREIAQTYGLGKSDEIAAAIEKHF